MVNVIGVRFQQNGKMFYFDADSHTPVMGDYVIVNTEKGTDLGEVVMGVRAVEDDLFRTPLLKMIRPASEQDLNRATENRRRESEAFQICQKKIGEHKLDMKLVSVECAFDNSKILFYFTANGRVDFRALVKDLAYAFKTRIELRQIGVRDEARMLGGLGPCGRTICCGSFLTDFQPVSIKMAKEQSLSLNPTKISGVCGRLMCCLKYEQDQYEQTRKRMPRVGREVVTPDGNGIVSDLNIVKETVSVRIQHGDESEIREFPLDQIARVGAAPVPARQHDGPERAAAVTEDAEAPGVTEEGAEQPGMAEEGAEQPGEESDEASDAPAAIAARRNREDQPETDAGEDDGTAEAGGSGKPEGERRRSGRANRSRSGRGNDRRGQKTENAPKGKGPGEGKREGNAAPEQKLGQPVRRENLARVKHEKPEGRPERKPRAAAGEKRPGPAPADARAQETKRAEGAADPAQGRPKKKATGWADALEKAMKAADDR